jgi:hypothetical protein
MLRAPAVVALKVKICRAGLTSKHVLQTQLYLKDAACGNRAVMFKRQPGHTEFIPLSACRQNHREAAGTAAAAAAVANQHG